MMIAKFGLVLIKHLMKHKPTNKLSRARRPSAKKMRTQVPPSRKRGPKPGTAGCPRRTATITFPRALNACSNRVAAIVEFGLTTQYRRTYRSRADHLRGGPWMRSE